MSNSMNSYYEQQALWGLQNNEKGKKRIIFTASMIPDDVISILDAGCGDGLMLNYLIEDGKDYQRIMGMDISEVALRYVKTEKLVASIDDIPFCDRSFDLVLCLEVLEHLPYDVYCKALLELQRVAKKYILISVPNKENIKKNFILCPECGCEFHPYRHLRPFSINSLSALFSDFMMNRIEFFGIKKQFIVKTYLKKIGNYLRLIDTFPRTALCPQCGYSKDKNTSTFLIDSKKKAKRYLLKTFLRKTIPHRNVGKWLIAL